jgi:hypothetical protein
MGFRGDSNTVVRVSTPRVTQKSPVAGGRARARLFLDACADAEARDDVPSQCRGRICVVVYMTSKCEGNMGRAGAAV